MDREMVLLGKLDERDHADERDDRYGLQFHFDITNLGLGEGFEPPISAFAAT